MSEHVAEGDVVIRPDTKAFRAQLQAQLAAATRGIVIPITISETGAVIQAQAISTATKGAAAAQIAGAQASRQMTSALREQQAAAREAARHMEQFSRGTAATGLSMLGLRGATLAATTAFLAGAGAITIFSKAVSSAVGFQRQLAVFAATTGATAAQLKGVEDEAKRLGADLSLPGITAADAAEAMTELAKAGLSIEQSMRGARGVLQLAIAANISFADATELAASALNAFQLNGAEATHVADVLANASNAAQGSIVDMGIALQQAAAVGHQVGLSFEDTTVFLTALARAGLRSSDAGTSLRVALIRLINPTAKAQKVFADLGIAVRDAQGNLRPEFFTNLGIALSNMSKKQRDATLALIGGQDAMRALSILSRISIKDLIGLRDELSKQGTASQLARARMTGLAGAGQNLSNTLANIALSIGQKANPVLADFVNFLTSATAAVAASSAWQVLGDAAHAAAEGFQALGAALHVIGPVLGTITNGLAAVAHSIGGGPLLAGVAAYLLLGRTIKTLGPALIAAASAVRLFAAQVAVSIALGGSMRAAMAVLGQSMIAFATSTAGITLGVTALAVGLTYLFTRESALERAQRHLKDSTEALADSFGKARQSGTDLADAFSSVRTDQLAVQTAKLAAEQAKQALENSKAAAGSFERAQLENSLQVALDNVRLAERQLRSERERAAAAQDVFQQADAARHAATQAEIEDINDLIAARKKELDSFLMRAILLDPEKRAQAEHGVNQKIIEDLQKRAEAERATGTAESINIAKRLEALATLARAMGGLQRPEIELMFNAKNVTQGLKQVEAYFRSTGQISAENFARALRIGFDPQGFLNEVMRPFFDAIKGLAGQGGKDAGDEFGKQWTGSVKQWLGVAAGFARQATAAQIGVISGGRGARLDFLKQEDEALRKALAGLKPSSIEGRVKIMQQIESVMGEIDSIENQIASERKQAATEKKRKADEAARKRQEADQAFLNMLGFQRGGAELGLTRAQATESLVDDLAWNRNLQALLRQQISQARTTIHDSLLRNQTILDLQTQLASVNNTIRNITRQQAENRAERARQRNEALLESIDLDISFAQTTKNISAEIRAHEAKIRALKAQQEHTKRGTNEWKRLRNEIAAETEAIKELRKQQADRAREFEAASFSFLQSQQGFAATLLGNLLPIGAVAGTVGGSIAAAGAGPSRPPDVGARIGAQAAVSGGPAGATSGQMGTLIDISRAMLRVLSRLAGGSQHPEAANQRAASSADGAAVWG